MHQDAEEFFAADWPRLADRLGRWLVGRGVPAQEVDDVVQETAFRLLRAWPGLDTTRAVDTLAHIVALNVWRDRATAAVRREVTVDNLPETLSPEDVERAVLARTDLARVVRDFFVLPVTQQAAVREAVGSESGLPRTAAVRMALMRARRALASGINGALVFVRTRPRRSAAAALSIAVGGAVVLGLLAPWHVAPPADPSAAPLLSVPVRELRDTVAGHGLAPVAVRHVTRLPHQISAQVASRKPANQPPSTPPPQLPPLPVPCGCYAKAIVYINYEVAGVHVRVAPNPSDPDHPACVEVNGEGPPELGC